VPTEALLNRIRGEFLEMPGLRLTCEQAQRLYGLDRALCQRALDRLVDAGFLCVTANRRYAPIADVFGAPHSDSAPARKFLLERRFNSRTSG
jgi:DNA-binding GntR family transcriptional regulator